MIATAVNPATMTCDGCRKSVSVLLMEEGPGGGLYCERCFEEVTGTQASFFDLFRGLSAAQWASLALVAVVGVAGGFGLTWIYAAAFGGKP